MSENIFVPSLEKDVPVSNFVRKVKAIFPVNAVSVASSFDPKEVEAILTDITKNIDQKLAEIEAIEGLDEMMLLVRWPRGLKLPDEISNELRLLNILGVPSISIQSPLDGAAMLGLMALQERRAEGPVGIEIEFDVTTLRLTNTGKYILLQPENVDLDTYHEIKPVFTFTEGATEIDILKARLLNRITSLRISARQAATVITPTGSLIPGDDSPPPVSEESDPF